MIFLVNILFIFNVFSLTLGRHAVNIYEGEDANIRDFPYMAALSINGKTLECGGAIINENTILLAAHCVTFFVEMKLSEGYYAANYGSTKFNESTVLNITKIIVHEDFVKISPFYNDIAVLKVDPPIVFSETAQPVKLPQMNAPNPEGKLAIVTGWGATNRHPVYPNILQKVNMTIAENETCENLYNGTIGGPVDTVKQICAMADTSDGKTRGVCYGDSGGPLVIDGVHYGIVSYGYDDGDDTCGSKKYPSVFARTANYIDWLSDKL